MTECLIHKGEAKYFFMINYARIDALVELYTSSLALFLIMWSEIFTPALLVCLTGLVGVGIFAVLKIIRPIEMKLRTLYIQIH